MVSYTHPPPQPHRELGLSAERPRRCSEDIAFCINDKSQLLLTSDFKRWKSHGGGTTHTRARVRSQPTDLRLQAPVTSLSPALGAQAVLPSSFLESPFAAWCAPHGCSPQVGDDGSHGSPGSSPPFPAALPASQRLSPLLGSSPPFPEALPPSQRPSPLPRGSPPSQDPKFARGALVCGDHGRTCSERQ